MSKIDTSIFNKHSLQQEVCPECGGSLSIRSSKRGPFLGCDNYPSCEYAKALTQVSEMAAQTIDGSSCPKCQSVLQVKTGRYGMFIGCSKFPDCDYHENPNQPKEQVAGIDCPQCKKGKLTSRTSRYGKIFYSCDAYPKCKYVLNDKPIALDCPACKWPVAIEKKTARGTKVICANKKCGEVHSPQ
ncbi:type I DNA topoisomerase [Paraferrimonas sp. SM1919]|uniref:DNA topoisomerase family protein n=1 Tax=Paraferrimonas sp. SM1919 TaxID=2662263 RepID=UPI0013D35848|nr:topoisomerase DNA-binding C4 zinc finger domain-containing protein [Paraferrimonas sp. SM1919]